MAYGFSSGSDLINIIIAATDKTAAAFAAVNGRMGALDKAADKVRTGINNVAKATAMIGGAAAIGAVVAGTKVFMDFEQSIANTASVSGATGEQLKQLEDAAREMGKTTAFSASQAADAMYFLGSAGYDTEQIISSLNGVMLLAGATQSDLAFTSETVVSTLNAFGLAASDSDRVANVFAATIGNSQATMDKLAYSMRYIGPVAKELGWSIEDTCATLGQLYNAGFKGEQAGTILRGSMTKLLDPSKEAIETLANYGITIDQINPKTHSMSEILDTLNSVGLETADAMRIFGQEAGPGMMSLLSKGSDAIEGLKGEITDTNAATEMYATQMDTLKGALTILKSALEEVGIILGTALMPYIREFAEKLKDALPKIVEFASKLKEDLQPTFENLKSIWESMKGIFGDLKESMDIDSGSVVDAINTITGAVAALFKWFDDHPNIVKLILMIAGAFVAWSYLMPVVEVISAIIGVISGAGGLTAVLTALGGPIGVIVLAVAALFVAWETNFLGIRDKTKAAYDFLKGKFDGMKERLTGFADHVKDKLGGITKKELLALASPAGPIVALKIAWDKNFFGIQDTTEMVVAKARGWGQKLVGDIANGIADWQHFLINWIDSITNTIRNSFTWLVYEARSWGRNIIGNIIAGLADWYHYLVNWLNAIARTIRNYLGVFSPAEVGPLSDLDKWGPNLIKTFTEGIKSGIPELTATLNNLGGPISVAAGGGKGSTIIYSPTINIGSIKDKKTADYTVRKIEGILTKNKVIST